MEEDLETERSSRLKSDQQRSEAIKELKEMQDRLEEAGGTNAVQAELNKKREAEVSKLKREAEQNMIQKEAAMANLRKKHHDAISDMEQQIEASNQSRQKYVSIDILTNRKLQASSKTFQF